MSGLMRGRIGAVRVRLRRSEILRGTLSALLVALASVIAALLCESILRPGPGLRTVLFWSAAIVPAGALCLLAGPPLLRLFRLLSSESDEEVASMIGAALPGVKDRLLNGLQLEAERERGLYSPELIDAALADLEAGLRTEEFGRVVTFAESRLLSRVLGGGALLALLLLVVFPDPLAGSLERLWRHGESFAVPLPFAFVVDPGDREVVKGTTVALTVRLEGEAQSEITLRTRREGEEVDETHLLASRGDGTFRYEFPPLRTSTLYSLEHKQVTSPRYRLTVVDRPSIRSLAVTLVPPAYSRLPVRRLDEQIGDISGLKGTRVGVRITTSVPCASGALQFTDGSRAALTLRGEAGEAAFTLRSPGKYRIMLRDSAGRENADPIDYTIDILGDAPPLAAITVPGANLDVTERTNVRMLLRITDDFGFSRLRIAYRLSQSRYAPAEENYRYLPVPIPPEATTEATIAHTWNLAPLNLVPEDVIEYRLEVMDNDAVSGPKGGVSEAYLFRYPSMDEVLAEVDREQEQTLASLEEALERAEESKRKLEEFRQELKKEGEKGEWQERKQAEELVARQAELQKTMAEAARAIEQTARRLEQNQLLSPETLEKYQELQKVMEQMDSPELAEAMKQLQQAMQEMSLEQMRQALQKFSFSEEQFRAGIERTLNLLKRIQIEQKLDALALQAEHLAGEQEEIRRETPSSRADTAGRSAAAARQRELEADAAALASEAEKAERAMKDLPGEMPLKEMQDARSGLDSLALDSGEIAESIEQGEMAEAQKGQERMAQRLKRSAEQMRKTKGAMQRNQQKELVAAMRRLVQDLLELSRRQEELKNGTRGLEQQSAQFPKLAQQQMEMLRDLAGVADRMGGMSNRSFSVTPEMGRSVGQALQQMGEALRGLEDRNGTAAGEAENSAMGALNESAVQAQNTLNAMMQSGGEGMGMSGLLQRLRQISGRQQGLNAETQGLTPEQASAMGRLAAEQGAVRKSLEQLAREANSTGQASRLLGDLKQVAEEMREVQTDLARGEVTEETLRRQERILSRLLDSQRSTQERDYENRRRAESGTNILRPGPGPIDLSTTEGRSRLRKDLLRALDEGYAREYEEIIRKYFEALER